MSHTTTDPRDTQEQRHWRDFDDFDDGISPLLWTKPVYPLHRTVPTRRNLHRGPLAAPVERFLARVPRPAAAPGDSTRDHDVRPVLDLASPDPEVIYLARRTLTLILEVWARRRPPGHLDELLHPTVARYTRVVAHQLNDQNISSARLNSLRICHPHADAAEVTAVCLLGRRPRALAARFERTPSSPAWRCRVLQLG